MLEKQRHEKEEQQKLNAQIHFDRTDNLKNAREMAKLRSENIKILEKTGPTEEELEALRKQKEAEEAERYRKQIIAERREKERLAQKAQADLEAIKMQVQQQNNYQT